jgi:methanogenic corrinoid protein MtbC1
MIKVIYDMLYGAYRKPQSAMVKVMSGGALIAQEFANQIGVVIFAPDASS